MRRPTRLALAALGLSTVVLALCTAVPEPVLAHGLVGRQDLPIPRWLFAWGAAVVLVVSFVALAVLWPKPRLEGPDAPQPRRVVRIPLAVEILAGAAGIAAFAFTVWAGFAGTQTESANLAPTVVYIIFWVGVPVLSLLFGDVFRAISPWRATARAAAGIAMLVAGSRSRGATGDDPDGPGGPGPLPEPLPYPARLGRWPAALGILLFAFAELVATDGSDPSVLATLAVAYFAIQLVGMSVYGIEPWTRNADAFGVTFSLYASLSAVEVRDRVLMLRRPLTGVTRIATGPGTVALLCVMIGTTSFDGFAEGPTWSDVAPDLARFFTEDIGLSAERGIEVAFTIGMLLMVLFVAALYRLGILGMRSIGGDVDATTLGRRFVHTLVPISLAYVVAHYATLLAHQGQAIAYLVSDPLGDGSDYLGTADSTIDYFITGNTVWYIQVAALILGHVAGLVLAHERALVVYRRVRDATRSQYWMLAVMVGFTSLGLWLLSSSA